MGDKVPEYFNGKIKFGRKQDGFNQWITIEMAFNYFIDEIGTDYYFFSSGKYEKSKFVFKISEVDALIEEHEREEQNNYKPTLDKLAYYLERNSDKNEPKQWIPQNGEKVSYTVAGSARMYDGTFIGMDGDYFVIGDTVGNYLPTLDIKPILPTVTKTHSEIAEIIGISKEQLKIVEG